MARAEDFRGVWTRGLIAWPDGRRDVATQVTWVQGPGLFADLRQPAGLSAGLSAAACRDDLTAADCRALAGQQGFSGRFEAKDGAYEWVRRIDFQPSQAARDIGRLFWRAEVLVEEGVETDYTEHWHRETALPEAACAALWLHDAARNIAGCLLRVGDWFAYVRGRAEAIAGETLASLVEGADTLARMQALVDCEISLGRAPAWRIGRSSLPYKRGTACAMRRQADRLLLDDLDAAGAPAQRVWDIAEMAGDRSMLLDAIPKCA